jgi:hypothetical protein
VVKTQVAVVEQAGLIAVLAYLAVMADLVDGRNLNKAVMGAEVLAVMQALAEVVVTQLEVDLARLVLAVVAVVVVRVMTTRHAIAINTHGAVAVAVELES